MSEPSLHAKVRAYHPTAHPHQVTTKLGLEPSRIILSGSPSHVPELGPVPESGWFLDLDGSAAESIWGFVEMILERFERRARAMAALREDGWVFDLVVGPAELVSLDETPDTVRDLAERIPLPLLRSVF